MALYSIAFSLSHIFSHNIGMQMVDTFGFEFTWNAITIFALLGVAILYVLMVMLKKEKAV
jgi:predicted MFS family arabinose efflux permease